jgi:uncharacterized repeat protein (TIGR03803 family)
VRQKKFWFAMSGILAVLAVALVLPTGAGAASKYNVLYKFTGELPKGHLIFDAAGNLYGTTVGTAFELTPSTNGKWTEKVLHQFSCCNDGYDAAPGLTFDAAGNLYGTTFDGGGSYLEAGTVFKLTPNSDGSWTESLLYSFTDEADGGFPEASVIFDGVGNLYGTTSVGGAYGAGVVFKLTPNSDGSWTESVVYSFTGPDGGSPFSDLIFDASGNLYGTTYGGGSYSGQCGNNHNGCGVVFKLTPNSDGSWTESVLHSFTGPDGQHPYAGLVFDSAGNLYGTTSSGGDLNLCNGFGCGVVFKLKPNADGSWTEGVLHYFHSTDGPSDGVIFEPAGNLFGTAGDGGPADGGAVFKLTRQSGGTWAYSTLRLFFAKPAENPAGGLVLDQAGNLYGTARCDSGCVGVLFEITP